MRRLPGSWPSGSSPVGAISQAVQPQLGEALVHENRARWTISTRSPTGWLVALTWPLYLLFIVFAPTILSVFGGGYSVGSNVLVLLSLSMLVATGCGMVDMVLLMAGRSSLNLINVLFAFGVNLGVDLVLIPPLGILGGGHRLVARDLGSKSDAARAGHAIQHACTRSALRPSVRW